MNITDPCNSPQNITKYMQQPVVIHEIACNTY